MCFPSVRTVVIAFFVLGCGIPVLSLRAAPEPSPVPASQRRPQMHSPPIMRYDWPVGQELHYEVQVEVDAGELGVQYEGHLSLKAVSSQNDRMRLRFESSIRAAKAVERRSLGAGESRSSASFETSEEATGDIWIDSRGQVHQSHGRLALPVIMDNITDVVFEPLPESPRNEWATGVSILFNVQDESTSRQSYSRSSRLSPPSSDSSRRTTIRLEGDLSYEIQRIDDDTVVVKKTYTMTPPDGLPVVIPAIQGTGTWKFNRLLNASESLEFNQKMTMRRGGMTITVPVKITYRLLSEAELAEMRDAEKREQEEEARRLADTRAELDRPRTSRSVPATVPSPRPSPGISAGLAGHFQRLLEHDNVRFREIGAKQLVQHATTSTIPSLIKALDDESPTVRSSVLQALARLKPPEAAEAVARRLTNDQDRASAVRTLQAIGPSAATAVLPYLEEASSSIQLDICRLLVALECDDKQSLAVMKRLADFIDNEDPELAESATRILGDASTRLASASSEETKEPPVPDRILRTLGFGIATSDPAIREWCARLTGSIGPEARVLKDKLKTAANDESAEVQQAAETALEQMEPSRVTTRDQAENDPAPAETKQTTEVPAKLIDVLLAMVEDPDEAVRYWSIFLVGNLGMGGRTAIGTLVETCEDESPAVRHASMVAVEHLAKSMFEQASAASGDLHALAEKINALPHGAYSEMSELEQGSLQSLNRIWPVEADRDFALGSRGRQPLTGPNSAEWFGYGGAGSWRVFEVKPGREILLRARGDEERGLANMVGDIRFTISEFEDGKWVVRETVDGPTNFHGLRYFFFKPTTDRIRLDGKGWFYFYVYQL